MAKIIISIVCDEGFVADSLRALASDYEDTLEYSLFVGEHFRAEIIKKD